MQNIDTGEEHPQVAARSTRTGRDQHGRYWGAIIENKTGHPVSPPFPRFSAPVYPPEKYVKPAVHGDFADAGDFFIDYKAWIDDLTEAWNEYNRRRSDIAYREYKETAAEALKKDPYELRAYVGAPPMDVRIPKACQAGNRWILGFTDRKPPWAGEIFPDPIADPLEALKEEFPDVEDEEEELPDAAQARSSGPARSTPRPGRRSAKAADADEHPKQLDEDRWELSNGDVIVGDEVEAQRAEAALREFADTV